MNFKNLGIKKKIYLAFAVLAPASVTDHHECEFGRWYFGTGRELYNHLAVFQNLDESHAKVHMMARHIAQLFEAGKKDEAKQSFSEFNSVTGRLFDAFDRPEEEINAGAAGNRSL